MINDNFFYQLDSEPGNMIPSVKNTPGKSYMNRYDILIIGGGIVGTATALELQKQFPRIRIALMEKEKKLALHQTGHNSGVIHAGVYYAPNSLKAEFCRKGSRATKEFCQKYQVPFRQCGKLLVATTKLEQARLDDLENRCQQNQITCCPVNSGELKKMEPSITGKKALLVPDSAITDYQAITRKMADIFQELGGTILLGHTVTGIHEQDKEVMVTTAGQSQRTSYLICCAGLYSDRMAEMMGIKPDFRIIPFRGEYYALPRQKAGMVSHLIYPVPDPKLPFLGVHISPTIDGGITLGPNAVLGYKKEGYGKINFSITDALRTFSFPGCYKLICTHLASGLAEMKDSVYKPGYLRRAKRYCPGLTLEDMLVYPAGIRAQAVKKDGSMAQDFLFTKTPRSLHVCNAPSPAATSAIPIAKYLVQQAQEHFPL